MGEPSEPVLSPKRLWGPAMMCPACCTILASGLSLCGQCGAVCLLLHRQWARHLFYSWAHAFTSGRGYRMPQPLPRPPFPSPRNLCPNLVILAQTSRSRKSNALPLRTAFRRPPRLTSMPSELACPEDTPCVDSLDKRLADAIGKILNHQGRWDHVQTVATRTDIASKGGHPYLPRTGIGAPLELCAWTRFPRHTSTQRGMVQNCYVR